MYVYLSLTIKPPIWCFQPIWKIVVKLDHFPKDRGENNKCINPPPSVVLGWLQLLGCPGQEVWITCDRINGLSPTHKWGTWQIPRENDTYWICLEDHPMTCKWLMVGFRPLTGVVGPLPNGRFMAYKWGLLTTVLTRMILQVFLHGRNQVVTEVVHTHTPLKTKRGPFQKLKARLLFQAQIFQGTCSYLGDGGPRYTVHITVPIDDYHLLHFKVGSKHQENPQHSGQFNLPSLENQYILYP